MQRFTKLRHKKKKTVYPKHSLSPRTGSNRSKPSQFGLFIAWQGPVQQRVPVWPLPSLAGASPATGHSPVLVQITYTNA